jgi:hypothetical protein
MRAPHIDQIGGGTVQRTFRMGLRQVFAGHKLTRDDLARMPTQNRNSLIETGHVIVWPRDAAVSAPAGTQRFVSPRGFGKYDVIEGRKLNAEALSREAAYELAGIPMPDSTEAKKTA